MDACFALIMLDLVFVSTLPRDRLRRTSPKWPILYHAGHKTLTQSICVGRSEQMGLCFYIGRRKWRNSILHEGSRHCDAQCRSVQRLDGWRSKLPYVVTPSTRSSLFLLRLGVLCLCIFCVRWMKNEVMWLMIHGWWKCFDPGARLWLTVGCLSGSTSRSNCRVECKLSKWSKNFYKRPYHGGGSDFSPVQSSAVNCSNRADFLLQWLAVLFSGPDNPQKLPLSMRGYGGPHLIHGSLGQSVSTLQENHVCRLHRKENFPIL